MSKTAVDDSLVGLEPEVDAFIRALLDRAAAIRVPELFTQRHPDALYWVGDRHGVSTVALRTPSLTQEQLVAVMTFRLAQYLMAHQLDPRLIYAERLVHEPLANSSAGDVHIVAGSAETGEILSYITLEVLQEAASSATVASRERPLFPVESVFGWGIFNRLRVLPELPVERVCELGRFMKNQARSGFDEILTRSTVELCHGLFWLLGEGLRRDIDIGIGDIEEGVAKKNLDFFHVPIALLHGVVPYAPESSFGYFNYQHRARFPFAFLCSDVSAARLRAIDQALVMPGKEGLLALLELKKEPLARRSSLEPDAGLTPLADAHVPQQGVPMATRRQLLDVGEWLRSTTLFRDLSVAEAAVLGTFLERIALEAGISVVRQGDTGDDVFLIEQGRVDVKLTTPDGRYLRVRELGPREYFGEIALIAGGERTADVIATTPLTVLRLTREAYERYLARIVEVERDLTKTALTRSHDTLRSHKPEVP